MSVITRRYVVVPPDLANLSGFDNQAGAEAAAVAHGDGTHVIDTLAAPYLPAVQAVEGGELLYVGHGSFDRRKGVDANLIEAVKKGAPPVIAAFLARGADPNATGRDGGTALHWAVGKGDAATVRLLITAGAAPDAPDAKGLTPSELARRKGREDLAEILSGI